MNQPHQTRLRHEPATIRQRVNRRHNRVNLTVRQTRQRRPQTRQLRRQIANRAVNLINQISARPAIRVKHIHRQRNQPAQSHDKIHREPPPRAKKWRQKCRQ